MTDNIIWIQENPKLALNRLSRNFRKKIFLSIPLCSDKLHSVGRIVLCSCADRTCPFS